MSKPEKQQDEKQASTLLTDQDAGLSHGSGGARILCVDDDVLGLRLRGEILQRLGYRVTLHSSPLEALRHDLTSFDLGIIDYEMPDLNGVKLLLAMRARRVAYPTILLSGYVSSLSPDDRALFYRCVEKSESPNVLLTAVTEYFAARAIPDFNYRGSVRAR